MPALIVGAVGVLGLAVAVVLGLAATKPATFKIQRRARIGAPPGAIFPHLEDFRRWVEWSPWEKLDPALQRTYGGADRGVGATYSWSGNNKAGHGKMSITESRPSEHLQIELQFIKPFPATNITTFTLAPADGGTEVTWTMDGTNTFMGKVFSVFADMDQLVGKDFEKGLENLKRVAEGGGAS